MKHVWSIDKCFLFILIAFNIRCKLHAANVLSNTNDVPQQVNVTKVILEQTNATNIRNYLRILTRNPHMAGTVHDDELADYIENTWNEQGLDEVKQTTYKCLLSYPDKNNQNKVCLEDANGNVVFTSKYMEDNLIPEDYHPDFVTMFNAYSVNGTVQGDLVYAHYARPEDFNWLLHLGINLTGKIVIAKYGAIFRGNKVQLAAQHGAAGVILFNDPSEDAQAGEDPENVYPNSLWLQSSGAQRGTLKTENGDPLTPGYPSIDDAFRITVEEAAGIPKIPCQPISYADARQLLRLLAGPVAPQQWQGPLQLNGTDLHLGPGFLDTSSARTVRLVVNNQFKTVNITNVIGIIRGTHEPDRYVMAGNHRDAWGFGAVDASSGTAQMLEVTRVLGQLVQTGWRPKRTLVFLSWGGEEFGLVGSTEFVEDNLIKLQSRAVAYVNTDVCTLGTAFKPNASPFLKHFLINITKQVPSPTNDSTTLFDTWRQYIADSIILFNETSELTDGSVRVGHLGGGTDHVPLAFFAGVASIDLTFRTNEVEFHKLGYKKSANLYPAYHTGFDTFHLVDNHIDPGYKVHRACAHINGLLLHNLADAGILPFNVTHYGQSVSDSFNDLRKMPLYDNMLNNSVNIDRLEVAVRQFATAARDWTNRLTTTDVTNPVNQRIINDQIMQVDKTLLLAQGLPLQKLFRHVIYSLSLTNYYGSSAYPGLQDLMFDIYNRPPSEATWTQIRRHLSDIIVGLQQATKFLQPVHII